MANVAIYARVSSEDQAGPELLEFSVGLDGTLPLGEVLGRAAYIQAWATWDRKPGAWFIGKRKILPTWTDAWASRIIPLENGKRGISL
ncbi:MAG: hypothetical protein PWQ13_282 [Bacillota bacterium]|nr:hypothetical protein [Bacillota bacterium]